LEKSNLFFDPSNHTYTFDNKRVPSVSAILLEGGFINTQFYTEEGRTRGSAVHKAIEIHCRGAHCFQSPAIDSYMSAFKNFEKDCDWVSEIVEKPMGCPQYAGTPDLIGLFQGQKTIIDIKTSATLSPSYALQLSAYEKLYRLSIPDVVFSDMPSMAIKRFVLQLTDGGKYILTEYRERSDRYIWDAAVAIHHWRVNNKISKGGYNG